MDANVAMVLVAMFTAISSMVSAYFARGSKNQAKESHKAAQLVQASVGDVQETVGNVQQSVGHANGSNIKEILHVNTLLLQELTKLQEYQHKRNHDIMALQASNAMRLHLLGKALGVDIPAPEKLDINTGRNP